MSDVIVYRPRDNRDRLVDIVDGDLRICETLSLALRLEGFQTRFAIDLAAAKMAIERRRPDAILCNSSLPDGSAVDLLSYVRGAARGVPIIAIEDTQIVDDAVELMRFGAAYVLAKPLDIERLLKLVRDEVERQTYPGGRDTLGRKITVGGFTALSQREREVLQYVVDGKSNKEAGRTMQISARTVEVHRSHIMKKLGAHNTAELVRIVLTS